VPVIRTWKAGETHRTLSTRRTELLAFNFKNVKGSAFPLVSNLFGSVERIDSCFRGFDGRGAKTRGVKAATTRTKAASQPWKYWKPAVDIAGADAAIRFVAMGQSLTARDDWPKMPQVNAMAARWAARSSRCRGKRKIRLNLAGRSRTSHVSRQITEMSIQSNGVGLHYKDSPRHRRTPRAARKKGRRCG